MLLVSLMMFLVLLNRFMEHELFGNSANVIGCAIRYTILSNLKVQWTLTSVITSMAENLRIKVIVT